MRNRVDNITATGGWQTLTTPRYARAVSVQARTSVDVHYRYRNQTDYWTVKAGNIANIMGVFNSADIEVMAAAGTVMEVEYQMYARVI